MLIRIVAVLSLLTLIATAHAADAPPSKPNILFLLSDDLGYGDLSSYGCTDTHTPHIDSLATTGLKFNQFYACPECTPTRASFLTGRYPQRIGGLECAIGLNNVGRYDDAIRLRESHDLGLPATETTLPKLLKQAGYTTALIGKWHLGYEPKFLPRNHGFDTFFGPLGGAVDYFTHKEEGGDLMLYRNESPVDVKGYMTDLITAETINFLNQPHDKPFFLYVAFTAPHEPIQGPDNPKADNSRKTYAAMVERLDQGVGQILEALDRANFAKNTIVIFASDNGGTKLAHNAPFTRAKGTTFEGGIRVPCLIRWPGVIPPGTVSTVPSITMDWTASFAALAGVKPPAERPFDGIDILSIIRNQSPDSARPLFWRLRRGENTRRAVRDGNLKFILNNEGAKQEQFLFDLEKDPAEQTNLLASHPADAQRLRALLTDWETNVRPTR